MWRAARCRTRDKRRKGAAEMSARSSGAATLSSFPPPPLLLSASHQQNPPRPAAITTKHPGRASTPAPPPAPAPPLTSTDLCSLVHSHSECPPPRLPPMNQQKGSKAVSPAQRTRSHCSLRDFCSTLGRTRELHEDSHRYPWKCAFKAPSLVRQNWSPVLNLPLKQQYWTSYLMSLSSGHLVFE